MEMYPKNNLYEIYKKNTYDRVFSHRFLDVTKKRTLDVMNLAINCCEHWDNSLDIGGGSGHYSIPLLSKFKKSVVVEVAKHVEHDYFKSLYKNFEYYNDFIENITFKEKFDFILLVDIFEHIVDIESFVGQLSLVQEKGGVVYILMPNALFCGPAEESALYYKHLTDGHQKHYLPNETIKLMNGKGYDLIHISHEEGVLRQTVRRIIKGVSRRDRKLNDKFFFYKKLIGPILHLVSQPLIIASEFFVYQHERSLKTNSEKTRAVAYIFKKIL